MADHDENYARYLQNVDQLAPLQVDSGSKTEEEEEEDKQCKRRMRSLFVERIRKRQWLAR